MTFSIVLHCQNNKKEKYGSILFNRPYYVGHYSRLFNLCINKTRKILIEVAYGNI